MWAWERGSGSETFRTITLSDGTPVAGYQETWWTFYPYVGLETKDSDEPGLKFFGSVRVGATPLTYQYATYFDTTAWPRCGITGQLEAGVRYQRFSLSAFVEVMTWGASAVVQDAYGDYSFQPDSRMLTLGGQAQLHVLIRKRGPSRPAIMVAKIGTILSGP